MPAFFIQSRSLVNESGRVDEEVSTVSMVKKENVYSNSVFVVLLLLV